MTTPSRWELLGQVLRSWTPEWGPPDWLRQLGTWLRASSLAKFLNFLYFYLFLMPYARLYLQGPYLWGFGFWNGLSPAEICIRLSGPSGPGPEHYTRYPDICMDMIERDIAAKLVFLETLVILPLVLYFLYKLSLHCCARQAN